MTDKARLGGAFVQPSTMDMMIAEAVVNSGPVIGAYLGVEWDEHIEDGQEWLAAVVREARRPLLAEIAALRAALEPFAAPAGDDEYDEEEAGPRFLMDAHRAARLALKDPAHADG